MTEEKAMESGNLSPLGGSEEQDPLCAICNSGYKQPRLLACLHTYCETCLESTLEKQAAANKSSSGKHELECPKCSHKTKIVGRGVVDSCPLEHIMVNELDRAALETLSMVCTSCKAKETAVARCNDCASFLCNNCVTAHRYMRCFESHAVVTFEELGGAPDPDQMAQVHRPLTCLTHTSELLKHYCLTCQVPICNECTLGEHKPPDHECERASEAGAKQREEMKTLLTESKNHLQSFEESLELLQNGLTDLQQQRDTAKTAIQEAFEKFKSLLEKRQEELLEELEKLHSEEELHIMDSLHLAEKTTEHIEEACDFGNRLLEHANAVELLSLKQVVSTRLRSLIADTPKLEAPGEIRFEFNIEHFERMLASLCGQLRQPRIVSVPSPPPPAQQAPLSASPTPSSSPVGCLGGNASSSPIHSASSSIGGGNMSPLHSAAPSLGGGASNGAPMVVGCTSMSPIHTSASLVAAAGGVGSLSPPLHHSGASSLDDAAAAGDPFAALSAGAPLEVGLLTSAAAQYNLARLANMAEGPEDPETNPDGPVTMADLLLDPSLSVSAAEQNVLNNLTALAKLGSVSLNNAGQIMLNGQVVPGLTLEANAQTSPPPPLLSSGRPSSSSSGSLGSHQQLLDSLLNGSALSPRSSSRGSPMLDSLVNGSSILGQRVPILAAGSGLVSPSLSVQSGYVPPPRSASTKLNTMQIRCKFGQLGPSKGQFSSPHGFCLGLDEEIIVADTNNHRIQVFDKSGEFKYTFGVAGKEEGQLWYPRKVAVIKSSGKYVICDRGNERSRMQIFTKGGHFIKKIAIRYIDIVAGLAITSENKIVAVDSVSPTVFVISEAGELLLWFDCSEYMREPSDIAISGREYYICDFKGHCVIVFNDEGHYIRKIGCDGMTNFPNGIDISDAGDVLVGDSHGNRFHVVVFSRDGLLLSEFECPYVKVSRCCGLKITSEGYVVTLAKNNHHVLVLNTLYIV
ncbi:LOW QUALITY PROTEIN: B-box type zinc finger protein ncl-1-like [Dermacentor silvarum]|uniref:LOW QUALITY PROTEIN: B-box type zinc finger protein ncl-1-like n=1 Tax=Dermacentor silvarum TaxID=543639 RepID=UPI002100855A|nr:LOW QUALITY PROTEIN: B-box type zinc finger protein ncl-1-like [Dermacentor silvarum]